MLAFILAAILPWLFWDQGVATANDIKNAGIEQPYVPADQVAAWKDAGFDARAFETAKFLKLRAPGVQYRMDVASATNVPWVDANGWRFERGGVHQYYYDAPWRKATLAAAEAYAYGVEAVIHTEPRDLPAFGRMLAFLRTIDRADLPVLANIGVVDDGCGMNATELLDAMRVQMKSHAENLEFETAARVRDRVRGIRQSAGAISILDELPHAADSADVFSGNRRSIPWAAASNSIATTPAVFSAMSERRRAAKVAMLTWSS